MEESKEEKVTKTKCKSHEISCCKGVKSDFRILVLGHTGSGKSTLINAMLGDHLAKQSYSSAPTPHATAELHYSHVAGMEIVAYDTPGFLDPRISTTELLGQLKNDYPLGFDLILLCYRIIDRVDKKTVDYLQCLCTNFMTNYIDQPFIVALTFGNLFLELNEIADLKHQEAKRVVINRKIDEIKTSFNEISMKSLNGMAIFDNIPFVITGTMKQRQLPNTTDWLNDLWIVCYEQCKCDVKPIINNFRIQLGLVSSIDDLTTTLASGISTIGMVVSTVIVPGLWLSIGGVTEAIVGGDSATTGTTAGDQQLKGASNLFATSKEQQTTDADNFDADTLHCKQEITYSVVCLPSAQVDDFSSDVFKAVGL